MIKFGSARIDENGKITGGKAGDQTGREVAIENAYMHSKGWLAFKPKDRKHALALAQAMIDACNNNNIGYDQNERLGVFKWVNGGTKIKSISTPCECDCSALVRACILEATGTSLANFNTSSEPNVLKNSGLFEEPYIVKDINTLEVGEILVTRTKGHTVICVEGNKPTGGAVNSPIKVDNKKLQPSQNKDASIAGTYMADADLKIRKGASTDYDIVDVIPKGKKCKCYGFYNTNNGTKWLCVDYNGHTGYASGKYLTKI